MRLSLHTVSLTINNYYFLDISEALWTSSRWKDGVRFSCVIFPKYVLTSLVGSDVYLRLRCLDEAGDSKI